MTLPFRRPACPGRSARIVLVALIAVSGRALAQDPPEQAAPPGVLVLYWQSSVFPVNALLETAFRTELKRITDGRVRYYAEHLETDLFPEHQMDDVLLEYLQKKYAAVSIDVVVASGFAPYEFLERNKHVLFPRTPRIVLGNPPWASETRGPPGTTGISPYRDYARHIAGIRRLHPSLTRVFIISGTLNRDKSFENVARADLAARPASIPVTYLTDFSLDELKTKVRLLPANSAILFAWQQARNDKGEVLESAHVVSAISTESSVPIYGMSARVLGSGIVGGELSTLEGIGTHAAQIAALILDGTSPDDIPVQAPPTFPLFDWRAMQRWHIPQDRLAPGRIIAYRPLTAWDRYRGYILAIIAFCALQGALIVGLIVERALRKRAEHSAEARQRELTHMQRVAAIGELSGALAHEIGQPLSAIRMNTKAAHELLRAPEPNRVALRHVLDEIDQANVWAFDVISRIRQVLRRKTPVRLAVQIDVLIADALALLRNELKTRAVTVQTRLAASSAIVPGDRVELQQVIINLVLNACDASAGLPENMRQVTVATAVVDGNVEVAITDRGPGIKGVREDVIFDPFVTTKQDGLGLGLAICRRIIVAHQGQIGGRENLDAGCTFWFRLPVQSQPVPQTMRAPGQRARVHVRRS